MKKSILILKLILINVLICYSQAKIKVACVGNSITYGASVENRILNNYPQQLENMLGEGFKVGNFGVSGATMLKLGDKPYWKENAFNDAMEFEANIVVIKLGTNDTKPQNWDNFGSYFKEDYISMINKFRSLPTKPIIVICMPVPVYEERWGIRAAVLDKEILKIVKEIAKEKDCQLVDLYTPLSNHPEYFPDKIHPNAAGAKVIAETVFASIKAIKIAVKK